MVKENNKMKNLEEIRKEVELIVDKLGKPIEENIKELVIGLRFCGIETEQSCEGHSDRGASYPWVAIPYEFAEKLLKVVAWQNRPKLANGSPNKNTWVIRPGADLRLMPERKDLPLKKLQKQALEFGLFLQNLSDDRFPEDWLETEKKP